MATRREQLYPEIKRLREVEGLKWREIGERLGLALSTVSDIYYDPTGEGAAQRKADSLIRTRRPCPRCGRPIACNDAEICGACWIEERKRAKRERMDDLAKLWNEGATLAEIKVYMGYGPNSTPPILSEMMHLGLIEPRREGVRRRIAAERVAA